METGAGGPVAAPVDSPIMAFTGQSQKYKSAQGAGRRRSSGMCRLRERVEETDVRASKSGRRAIDSGAVVQKLTCRIQHHAEQ